MSSTGFALGQISSACPPLVSRATGLHIFQELLPALLIKWGWETLSTVSGAVTQHLAWIWANQTLSLTKLSI